MIKLLKEKETETEYAAHTPLLNPFVFNDCHGTCTQKVYSIFVTGFSFFFHFSIWWLRRDNKAPFQRLADSCSSEKVPGGRTSPT